MTMIHPKPQAMPRAAIHRPPLVQESVLNAGKDFASTLIVGLIIILLIFALFW